MENSNKLSIINPALLKDPGISVDSECRFEKEDKFNSDKVVWKFYGNPYCHKVLENGSIKTSYGFNHAWGYIECISDLSLKYDIIYGLMIKRIDFDDELFDLSDSDSESDTEPTVELNNKSILKKNQQEINYDNKKCLVNDLINEFEIYIDENNNMDFESEYDSTKKKFKFYGNPSNKYYKYGYDYANGLLILLSNHELKFILKNGLLYPFSINDKKYKKYKQIIDNFKL